MGDPSPWLTLAVDSVAAVGAAGAAIVAVVLAGREQRERQATQRQLAALRDQEDHQDLRRVIVTVRRDTGIGIVTAGVERKKATSARWTWSIKNGANRHITDVTVTIWPEGEHDPALRERVEVPSIEPGDTARQRTREAHAYILHSTPAFITTFNDASGRAWIINEDGELSRADAAGEPHGRGRRWRFLRRKTRSRESYR